LKTEINLLHVLQLYGRERWPSGGSAWPDLPTVSPAGCHLPASGEDGFL